MKLSNDSHWFSLARQPQEPLMPNGETLTGDALDGWRERFRPLLDYLKKKEVVLALSGGGMALVCHVSVLRVIELLSIRVDRIVGTSAGAVIGGLHAAGMNATEIENSIRGIESPDELFGFAAKHMGLRLLAAGVRRKLMGPDIDRSGIYGTERIEEQIGDVLRRNVGSVPTLGELKRDYSCVALNIGTGKDECENPPRASKAVFSTRTTPDIPLTEAISASLCIPGVFTPKRIGGSYYIDGGVLENLPIVTPFEEWLARKRRFGKKLAIIAVDLGYGGEALTQDRLAHPIDLSVYADNLQNRAITQYGLLRCHRPEDGSSIIVVRPKLCRIGLTDIDKIPDVMYPAYTEAVRQLSGPNFMDGAENDIRQAREFLGIQDLYCGRRRGRSGLLRRRARVDATRLERLYGDSGDGESNGAT